MKGFLCRALDERPPTSTSIVAITVPVPALPTERLVDSTDSVPVPELRELTPILRWDSPAPDADGRAWSFAGWGETARIEANGDGRFDEIRRAAEPLFASVIERRHPDVVAAPPPRIYGGLAFRPEAMRAEPWSAYRDGSFSLPRFLYGSCGDSAFLRLYVRGRESIDEGAIDTVLRRLQDPTVRSTPAPPSTVSADLERTSPETWEAMIRDALAQIRARTMEKVVPMTLCRVAADRVLDAAAAVARLGLLYPDCVRFAFQRGASIFVGASPERLVDKRGLSVEVDALAGSAARRLDGEDPRAAAALLESDKDRREHRVVVDAVKSVLDPLSQRVRIPGGPVIRTLRNVHHLWTPITATLTRPTHVLDLVRALHPTPAVCGTPRDAAIRWIAAHELAPRGWYAGAVGWFDAVGDGAFSVAIRSGVLARREAWLYAGAGIVEGSDAGAEYAETGMKQTAMLSALGLLP